MPKQSLPSTAPSTTTAKQKVLDGWILVQKGSYYRLNWKPSNKTEAALLENYWANGGTPPVLVTFFGQGEVSNAEAYWML
jgi:hypothetical protein